MKKRLFTLLLLLSLLGLTACSGQNVCQIQADRLTQASTVPQLQEVSDLIVVFTPESQEEVLFRYTDGNVSSGYTRTEGKALQVLKGDVSEGAALTITEECYTVDDTLWTQGGYLPMEIGQSYLLFLSAYDADSDYAGMYFPTELEYGKYLLSQTPLTAESSAQTYQIYASGSGARGSYADWYQQVSALYPQVFG